MFEPDETHAALDPSLLAGRDVVLFEDAESAAELFPLNVLRPSWEIRCGAGCLREWVAAQLGVGRRLILRPHDHMCAISAQLARISGNPEGPDHETVFLNGRVIGLWSESESAEKPNPPWTVTNGEGRALIAIRNAAQTQDLLKLPGTDLARELVKEVETAALDKQPWTIAHARYPWDFMRQNAEILRRQLGYQSRLFGAHALRELPAGVQQFGEHKVHVGEGSTLRPGAVLNTESGPIWIGTDTEIEPHTYLVGPLWIGDHCRVKAGTTLYRGSSFGPHCRVAGEISQSIFQGYVNKQHDGFVGNSVLGEWVNLGADTVTSNLRNDYGEVKVRVGDHRVRTGECFIGLMAGDHTKTGINTMFNTGSVVGVGASVFGAGYPPQFIPSFAQGGAETLRVASLERTLSSARIVMSRRGRELTDAEEELLRRHFEETHEQEK